MSASSVGGSGTLGHLLAACFLPSFLLPVLDWRCCMRMRYSRRLRALGLASLGRVSLGSAAGTLWGGSTPTSCFGIPTSGCTAPLSSCSTGMGCFAASGSSVVFSTGTAVSPFSSTVSVISGSNPFGSSGGSFVGRETPATPRGRPRGRGARSACSSICPSFRACSSCRARKSETCSEGRAARRDLPERSRCATQPLPGRPSSLRPSSAFFFRLFLALSRPRPFSQISRLLLTAVSTGVLLYGAAHEGSCPGGFSSSSIPVSAAGSPGGSSLCTGIDSASPSVPSSWGSRSGKLGARGCSTTGISMFSPSLGTISSTTGPFSSSLATGSLSGSRHTVKVGRQ